jgi:hypothetical protein
VVPFRALGELPGGLWCCLAGRARGLRVAVDGLGEVLPQVEPVRDLDSLRCPGPGPVRIGTRAVSANDLCSRVGGQPVGQGPGVAALEQVQRRAGLAVNDDGAVVLAAPDREVVDPNHPRGRRRRVRDGHDQPEQDLPGHGDAQAGGQPRPRPPGQRDPDAPEHPGQQRRLPRIAWSGCVPARRTSCARSRGPCRRTAAPPAGSPPADRRSRRRPASWRSGCGPCPTPSRSSGTRTRGQAPWP